MAAAIYLAIMIAIYWPVFLGQRFFWEDFFIQEYPIREYSYYMAALKHALPFWNPYSWAFAPMLADAQCGFWYPSNLLQIGYMMIFHPGAQHLPAIVPEVTTLLHMPLAALGMFQLTRKRFKVPDLIALVAGVTFGFGVRMVAEQNHTMFVLQLALLPWEMLLLMRGWKEWRYAVGFGLLFGISFLGGQPQLFFFAAIFFGSLTLTYAFQEWRSGKAPLRPILHLSLGALLAAGVAAIQMLPSMELARLSARATMSFYDASGGAIHLGHFVNFFVPRFYGEFPGFYFGEHGMTNRSFYYWEATFYWSALAEILALFAIVIYWKRKDGSALADPQRRFARFAAIFSLLALAFGMGRNLYFQWIFWRFLPVFDQMRGPHRMIWFMWLMGSIYGAIGLQALIERRSTIARYRRFFQWACGLFLAVTIVTISGIPDMLYKYYAIGGGLVTITLPALIVDTLVAVFLCLYLRGSISQKAAFAIAAILIFGDLYYNDATWHRNTLSPARQLAGDSALPIVTDFKARYQDGQSLSGHGKIAFFDDDTARGKSANFGMFLRLPIEFARDSEDLKRLNPMRLARSMPLAQDSLIRMQIMGVTAIERLRDTVIVPAHTLPFLKLYSNWKTSADSNYSDFENTILLDRLPGFTTDTNTHATKDSVELIRYDENRITIRTRSSSNRVLFVNDLFYPAWDAQIDGRKTQILRAFVALRAIPIPKGEHTVTLQYRSPTFEAGWKISAATIALCLALMLTGLRRRKTRGPVTSDRT